jgi:uncharacterized protein with GYD domain
MRFVLLGKINPEWVTKVERFSKSKEKMKELGIELESVNYTQGAYDFVDIVETDDPHSVLTFSVWYNMQGYGSMRSMPSYTPEEFQRALEEL